MTQLIIVDDNPRDRIFLSEILVEYNPISTANAEEALDACRTEEEPWVVTDIQMPGRNGIELARIIWKQHLKAKLLFCSQYCDETYVRTLSKLTPPETVYGYVLKSNSAENIVIAAKNVFQDEQCWLDPKIRTIQARTQRRDCALSDVEFEALINIALGLTDMAIAERCYLSKRGVQNRLKSLYLKLGAGQETINLKSDSELMNTRSRAVAIALQRGLINAYELEKEENMLKEWLSKK